MKPKLERRFFHVDLRASRKDGAGTATISGYAAVFNQPMESFSFFGENFREIIAPGAFSRALKEKQDVRCLFNHDPNFILGRTKSGTLSLKEDRQGLFYECEPPVSDMAQSVVKSIERGDVDGSSFGFTVQKQEWTEEKDAEGKMMTTRTILDADLYDVSPVTYPAYSQTTAEARQRMLFPEGVPAEVRSHVAGIVAPSERRNADCECDCPECQDGDCEDCSNTDCDDPNCEGSQDRAARVYLLEVPASTPADVLDSAIAQIRSILKLPELRAKITKRVDGEDLTADCFVIVGDSEDPKTWKLPWKFSTEAKTQRHLRNALARFNQLKGVSQEDKDKAWKKLVSLCKEHDIDVSDENSAPPAGEKPVAAAPAASVAGESDADELELLRMKTRTIEASL